MSHVFFGVEVTGDDKQELCRVSSGRRAEDGASEEVSGGAGGGESFEVTGGSRVELGTIKGNS